MLDCILQPERPADRSLLHSHRREVPAVYDRGPFHPRNEPFHPCFPLSRSDGTPAAQRVIAMTNLLNLWHPISNWAWWRTDHEKSTEAEPRDVKAASITAARPREAGAGAIWVTVLVENTVQGRSLQAEHGLSFLIRANGHCVLFDTGQSELVVSNARVLDVPLDHVDAIALSHGHYDHTGGLKAVHDLAPQSRIYLHPAAVARKFAGNSDGTSRPVGMSDAVLAALRSAESSIVWTRQPTPIAEGIFVTGEIPRQNSFEDTGGRFFLDEACSRPDPLIDDQAVFFDTEDGIVVLLGCAHAGVVNTVEYIRQITGRPLHAVLGGFHLWEANAERLSKTLRAIESWNLQRLAPAHCTGMTALTHLWSALPGRCFSCPVGTSIGFQTVSRTSGHGTENPHRLRA
jgi:7,8-dihydropterin-6-yl-methyl-4-(beta-D-ribofuranosyl)aminobenzene 5'-phosphate synthase